MSDAELVMQFTKESGCHVCEKPELMSNEETMFLIKMMLDEIMELGATVGSSNDVKNSMINMIKESKDIDIDYKNIPKNQLIGLQADALVDSYYYSLNASCKKGVNISKIFSLVHQANMNKKDKVSGKFLKRSDGKIIKPQGWEEPDITAEIDKQNKEGGFTNMF